MFDIHLWLIFKNSLIQHNWLGEIQNERYLFSCKFNKRECFIDIGLQFGLVVVEHHPHDMLWALAHCARDHMRICTTISDWNSNMACFKGQQLHVMIVHTNTCTVDLTLKQSEHASFEEHAPNARTKTKTKLVSMKFIFSYDVPSFLWINIHDVQLHKNANIWNIQQITIWAHVCFHTHCFLFSPCVWLLLPSCSASEIH